MTDRINALVVVLEKDIRDDDIEATRNAIMQIKGVISVGNNVADHTDFIAKSRVQQEVTELLFGVIKKLNNQP